MKKFVCALALALSLPAYGAPQWCTGRIAHYLTWANGDVSMLPTWRQDYVTICNLQSSYKGVEPSVCVSWFALLQSAVTSGRISYTHYQDAPACNAIPTYGNAPTPAYVLLTNQAQ